MMSRPEWEQQDTLSTVLAFVDVRVEVNVGYVAVEHGTSGFDHAIGRLWAHADCVSAERILKRVYRGERS